MNEMIEAINLSSTLFLSYLITNTPLGYIIFFNWLIINKYKIWILKILIPHVVEPAQPPINIKVKKKIRGKFPHPSNSPVTYPVPLKIEITLKEIARMLIWERSLFWKSK